MASSSELQAKFRALDEGEDKTVEETIIALLKDGYKFDDIADYVIMHGLSQHCRKPKLVDSLLRRLDGVDSDEPMATKIGTIKSLKREGFKFWSVAEHIASTPQDPTLQERLDAYVRANELYVAQNIALRNENRRLRTMYSIRKRLNANVRVAAPWALLAAMTFISPWWLRMGVAAGLHGIAGLRRKTWLPVLDGDNTQIGNLAWSENLPVTKRNFMLAGYYVCVALSGNVQEYIEDLVRQRFVATGSLAEDATAQFLPAMLLKNVDWKNVRDVKWHLAALEKEKTVAQKNYDALSKDKQTEQAKTALNEKKSTIIKLEESIIEASSAPEVVRKIEPFTDVTDQWKLPERFYFSPQDKLVSYKVPTGLSYDAIFRASTYGEVSRIVVNGKVLVRDCVGSKVIVLVPDDNKAGGIKQIEIDGDKPKCSPLYSLDLPPVRPENEKCSSAAAQSGCPPQPK